MCVCVCACARVYSSSLSPDVGPDGGSVVLEAGIHGEEEGIGVQPCIVLVDQN